MYGRGKGHKLRYDHRTLLEIKERCQSNNNSTRETLIKELCDLGLLCELGSELPTAVIPVKTPQKSIPFHYTGQCLLLDNKHDHIRPQRYAQRDKRDCYIFIFMEMWLKYNIPDAAIQITGLTKPHGQKHYQVR